MTCIRIGHAIVCTTPFYRLPLADGGRVFMDWHHYCGPVFFKDKNSNREIMDWYDNPHICAALAWFIKRGKKA